MLSVTGLSVAYGKHQALNDVSVKVAPGEIVVILGANGAGKSTLLKAISGICEGQVGGHISHNGTELQRLTSDEIVSQGVALVPEGRGIFPELTVIENLKLGAYSAEARDSAEENLERVFELFPRLKERQKQRAGTMSGGEQQMVAIGRAMMSNPRILTLDEPSLGLSPLLTKELFQNLKRVKAFGLGILLVEQNARQSLAIADRGYLLENTRIIKQDRAQALLNDPQVQAAYLGGGGEVVVPAAARGDTSGSVRRPEEKPVDKSDLPRIRLMPESTASRSADQVLGRSVSELVKRASETSTDSVAPFAKPAAFDSKTGQSGDRIETIYRDIEAAAQRALQRNRITPRPTNEQVSKSPAVKTGQPPDVESDPVRIEVYRPPRVEVYKRRESDEQFVREER